MIRNLFSIFDPASSILSLNWFLILLMYSLSLPLRGFKKPRNLRNIGKSLFKALIKETGAIIGKKKRVIYKRKRNNFETIFPVALGLGIVIINVSALYPHVFPLTAQLVITLSLALFHWLWTTFLPRWIKKSNHTLTHLVPQGTPPALINFIVLIELIRRIIRPLTLCVRLTANMIAGHLLLTLLGNIMITTPIWSVPLMFPLPLVLTILEIAVALIQSYVFMTLITLYIEETL